MRPSDSQRNHGCSFSNLGIIAAVIPALSQGWKINKSEYSQIYDGGFTSRVMISIIEVYKHSIDHPAKTTEQGLTVASHS